MWSSLQFFKALSCPDVACQVRFLYQSLKYFRILFLDSLYSGYSG